MATYAFMLSLTANTVAKRDAIYTKIETFLSGKPIWGRTSMSKGTEPQTSRPSLNVEVRFKQRPNLDNLLQLAKTELNKLTGVKASLTGHICKHDETPNTPCVIEELVSINR